MINKFSTNTLKVNGIATINNANSGHPGIVLSAATILNTLWTKHMNFDPKNPTWLNRDRFILSAGHGSALLYAQLRLLELISEKDLKEYRQLGSKTPGHPEFGKTKGVEATTGPLGQGIAMAVGMAISEEALRARFPEINHYIYVVCGDGDLQEGISYEAMSLAGTQKLSHLIVIHDSNDVQLDTLVKDTFNENIELRIKSMGWDYFIVEKNTSYHIDEAIKKAKKSKKPCFIEVKTIIGEGAIGEGTPSIHGTPLSDESFKKLKEKLRWTYGDFEIPKEVKEHYYKTIFTRGAKEFKKWKASLELQTFMKHKKHTITGKLAKNVATRITSGEIIQKLNAKIPQLIGGSADLASATKVFGGDGEFTAKNRLGRNIRYGVREFAMGSITNGIQLHANWKPFIGEFFVFSDYLKPSIRLAALMKLPNIYIFTHDSIVVGKDGPTHQPIEQLATFRSMPNINVFRPADEEEVRGAYEIALNSKETPTIILLTRQNIKSLENTHKNKVAMGAYKLRTSTKSPWTLIASGSELANAYEIGKELNLTVISLVNARVANIDWDINKAISIEAATTYGLSKYAKFNIGVDTFGISGDGDHVYEHFNFDHDSLIKTIQLIIK